MIRPATREDDDRIRDLLDASFAPSRIESRIYAAVAAGDDPFFAWVAEIDSAVVACILYTPATRDSVPIGYCRAFNIA